MDLVVAGVNHESAPIDLRERLALSVQECAALAAELARGGVAAEAVVLSTCNRVEVYAAAPDGEAAATAAERDLARARGVAAERVAAAGYRHRSLEAVRHVFRVTASLDSMVVGEAQITGQVKEAFAACRAAGAVGPLLSRWLERAFAVARRVRNETAIGRLPVSIPSVAVSLAERVLGDLSGRRGAIVGAGEMAELAARHLREAGARDLVVVNRTEARARALAEAVGASARPWDDLGAVLADADVAVTATGSEAPILGEDALRALARARRHRPLVLLDIAVPRDVDPAASRIEDLFLFDIDAIGRALDHNRAERARHARDAEAIVAAEAEAFVARVRQRRAAPAVRALRERFLGAAAAERERLLRQHPGWGERERERVVAAFDSLVGKLLHEPATALRRAEADGDPDLAHAARRLFALPGEEAAGGDGAAAGAAADAADGPAAAAPAPAEARIAAAEPAAAAGPAPAAGDAATAGRAR